jgi:hypothetical protein
MRGTQSLRHAYVRVPLLFLLVISPVAILATTGVSASVAACTNATVDAAVLDTNVPFTQQSAVSLTESSAEYLSAVSGYSSTLLGIGNEWNFDSATCSVSFDSFAMNYLLKATNGTEFELTLGVKPQTSDVFGATIRPVAEATLLPINHSSSSTWSNTYSGYALAANGNYNSAVSYTTAYWYIPEISAPSGGCGSSASSSPPECMLDVWTGLQNSTYDGTNYVPAHGEVFQTGTEGTCSSSCTGNGAPSYSGWSEYLNGDSSGVVQNLVQSCNSDFSASAGDEMYGVVGTAYEISGGSSSTFDTELRDFNNGSICDFSYSSSTSCGQSDCNIAGTEYFADYFIETPQDASDSGTPFMLPKFTEISDAGDLFYVMGMLSSSQGSYPYYNDGYYLTSDMGNGGTHNTHTSAMSENAGSTYAYFNENWLSSANTG